MNINKTLCVRRILLGGRKDSLFATRQHLHSSMSSDPSCDMVEGEKCKCGIMCVCFFRRSRSLLYLVSREELTITRVDQKCNITYIFAVDSLCKSIKALFVLQFQSCFFLFSSRPCSIPLRIYPLGAPWWADEAQWLNGEFCGNKFLLYVIPWPRSARFKSKNIAENKLNLLLFSLAQRVVLLDIRASSRGQRPSTRKIETENLWKNYRFGLFSDMKAESGKLFGEKYFRGFHIESQRESKKKPKNKAECVWMHDEIWLIGSPGETFWSFEVISMLFSEVKGNKKV